MLHPRAAHAKPPLDERGLEQKVCNAPAERSFERAERAAWRAERERASVGPNPRLEAQHLRTLDGPTDRETIIGLAVPFVVSGRMGLLRDAAGARGREAEATVRARKLAAVIEAKRLWTRAVLDQARRDVLVRQQQALDGLTKAMAELARGGEAAGYDTLRQGVEARAHRQSLARARAQAAASKRALEAWLGEPVALPALAQSGLGAPDAGRRRGSSEHPSLVSLRASAHASELEARAERRRAIPDPEVFVGYRQLDVEGATGRGIALGLTLPLPLFDHGQGDARRADAAALRARAELGVEQRRLQATRASELGRLQLLESELARTTGDARDADQLRDGARKLYAAGEISIVELLDAYRAAEAAELSRLDTFEEIALSRVELAAATGSLRACEETR